MILTTRKDPTLENDYLDIQYRELTPVINQIIEICNKGTQILIGDNEGEKHNIDVNEVLYIEWVDNRSCICTENQVFTTPQNLFKLEQQLDANTFIRISKPILVNVYKIKWISSGLNMKLMAELINGERVSVSRHYRGRLLNAIYNLGKELKI